MFALWSTGSFSTEVFNNFILPWSYATLLHISQHKSANNILFYGLYIEIISCCDLWEPWARDLSVCYLYRADSRFAPTEWGTVLLCSDFSHWLGTNLESALSIRPAKATKCSFRSTICSTSKWYLHETIFARTKIYIYKNPLIILSSTTIIELYHGLLQ